MHHHGLDHTFGEHVADAIIHAVGVLAAVAGATGLIVWAALEVPGDRLWPLIPYALGLVATFTLSAAYNLTLHGKIRAVLRRFDHAAIYLMIAGTYTPMAIIGIGGGRGLALATAAWGLAIFGITLKLAFFHRWHRLGFVLYLGQGWLGVIAAWPLMQNLPTAALVLLVVGGVTYTIGAFVFETGWRFTRAVWHGHVLAAAATHFAAVVMIAAVG